MGKEGGVQEWRGSHMEAIRVRGRVRVTRGCHRGVGGWMRAGVGVYYSVVIGMGPYLL